MKIPVSLAFGLASCGRDYGEALSRVRRTLGAQRQRDGYFNARSLVALAAATTALLVLGGATAAHAADPLPGASTAAPVKAVKELTVAPDGTGNYKSLVEAIAAVPDGSTTETVIHLKPGVYAGPFLIPKTKPHLTLRGDDAATTILTYDRNVQEPVPEGFPDFYKGTGVVVLADDFRAEKVAFRNTSGDHGQALALRIDGDRAVLNDCRLLGWQDTLMVNNGRHYFRACYIEGRVDFIYGSATVVFDRCEIHSKNGGHITAANTPADHPYGYVFLRCKLTGDPTPWVDPSPNAAPPKPRTGPVRADLGRPWRPYAAVAYLFCEMGDHIKPEGWDNWRNPENEKTARYREYRSTGTGANPEKRVAWSKQLTDEEAANYTLHNILGGTDNWDPGLSPKTAAEAAKREADYRAAKVKIVLAGDSTVTDDAGWGAGFREQLKPDAGLINLSRGGRSSKSFREEGLWAKALSLKPDYVLIQFGHNDQPGHGPDRETDASTTYRANIERYVDEARAAGITPVLVTPMSRRQFGTDGKIHSTLEPYADAVRAVAAEKKVPLIDLHRDAVALWEKLGPTGCQAISPRKEGGAGGYDGTHLNAQGGEDVGKIVAASLRQAVPALDPELETKK